MTWLYLVEGDEIEHEVIANNLFEATNNARELAGEDAILMKVWLVE